MRGTKCAPHYILEVPAGEQVVIRQRFFDLEEDPKAPYFGEGFEKIFADRIQETDDFYKKVIFV